MKKLIIFVMCTFALVGCNPKNKETTQDYNFPKELQDCKAYWLFDTNGGSVTVIRCPNSNTTTQYQSGKTQKSLTVIEDE